MTIELLLSKGRKTIIDKSSLPLVKPYVWYYGGRQYAVAKGRDNKDIFMHRLVLGAAHSQLVDHINGDSLDNRVCNLRICTSSQNSANRNKSTIRITTSKYKGVHLVKAVGNFCARINVEGIRISLGSFSVEEEAALAYNKAAIKHFGEFAKLNTIER